MFWGIGVLKEGRVVFYYLIYGLFVYIRVIFWIVDNYYDYEDESNDMELYNDF